MTASHDEWDELAAGYALHALEPDEERRFTDHLAGCEECAGLLREHELVAAQLGSLAHAENADDAPAPEWSAIRAGVVSTPAPVSLDARRERRRQPWLLGAAAAVLVAAGGAVVVFSGGGTTATPAARAIAACRHETGCAVIRLHAAHGADPGAVLVADGKVTMVPLAMKAPAPGTQYVLWQLLRSGAPTPVAVFRNASEPATSPLVMAASDTAAYAVSVEPDTWPPAQPTHVVAIGNTPA